MMQRWAWIGGFCLAACASSSKPAPSGANGELSAVTTSEPAPPTAPAAESTSAAAGSSAPVASATPSSPAPGEAAKASGPSIHDVCFAMCDKVKEKCPKSAFESCRVNCGKYESPAEGCEDVVKSALSCAREAADLVCANVAPESCAKQFRQISACASGQKPLEAKESGPRVPHGFALYENAALGIHAPMPTGTAAGAEPSVVVQAKGADSAVYSIRKLPRPDGKLNEKVFLKLALNLFGRCSDKMKMQGMVDKPGRTSINYTMKCPDGAEEMGLFWATDKALFIASVRGGPSKEGAEAFLYGFEAK